MMYRLDERIVRENLLCRHFPKQRNITTIGECLVGYNHPEVKKGKEDLGPNCFFIQKRHNFLSPSFKSVIKKNYYDPGIIVWAIELMKNRCSSETNKNFREEQYLFIEKIVPYKRIPIWNWKLGAVNNTYMDYMNESLEKFEWKNSVFHENLRINNSMSKFTDNAKYNIDLFSFAISAIAEASNLTKLYRKSGYISMAGYFKNEITRDILFKIIQGIYYDFYPEHQYDMFGNIIYGHEIWNYKIYYISDIIKQNPVIKGESLENYNRRVINTYAEKLYNWYFPQPREDSQMSIYRIQKGINFSTGLRSKNRTSNELFMKDF